MKSIHCLLVFLSFLAAVSAQTCGAGSQLLKNDVHPALPTGATTVGVVPGLCEGEAAMSIFQTGGPVTVNSVAVMFGAQFGTNGVQAAVDVEIYDGATALPNGTYVLGPRLFRLSDGGSNLQIQSHGLNTYILPVPVRSTSGQVVVGYRMVLNTSSGSCLFGYSANFCTDADNSCRPGINVIDAIGHGPVDPVTYAGFGLPLCPSVFRGSWMIRACVTPEITTNWTGNPTPGGIVQLQLRAPGHGNEHYLLMAANGISQGFSTPWGRLPLDNDWLFSCFFGPCRAGMFIGDYSILSPGGDGFAVMLIPNISALLGSNFPIYCAFVTSQTPAIIPFSGISSPSSAIVIR